MIILRKGCPTAPELEVIITLNWWNEKGGYFLDNSTRHEAHAPTAFRTIIRRISSFFLLSES